MQDFKNQIKEQLEEIIELIDKIGSDFNTIKEDCLCEVLGLKNYYVNQLFDEAVVETPLLNDKATKEQQDKIREIFGKTIFSYVDDGGFEGVRNLTAIDIFKYGLEEAYRQGWNRGTHATFETLKGAKAPSDDIKEIEIFD